jgi:hypothetical protein
VSAATPNTSVLKASALAEAHPKPKSPINRRRGSGILLWTTVLIGMHAFSTARRNFGKVDAFLSRDQKKPAKTFESGRFSLM